MIHSCQHFEYMALGLCAGVLISMIGVILFATLNPNSGE